MTSDENMQESSQPDSNQQSSQQQPYGQFQQDFQQQPYGQFQQDFQQQPYGQFQQDFQQQPYGQFQQNFQQQPYGQFQQDFQQQPYGQFQQDFQQQPYGQFQQNFQQQPYGQFQQNFQQQPYGQFQQTAPKPPKPPRKPLSNKAKIGIISGIIAAALLVVFFVVILPILTRSKLAGEYTYTDSWGNDLTAVFDDGTYAIYDDDELEEAGTYYAKKDRVFLTDIEGYEKEAKFNNKDNKLRIDGNIYKSSDKKGTLDFKLTEDYYENLKKTIDTSCKTIIANEDIYNDLYWNSCWIYDDALKNPNTDFKKELAKALGYSEDATLQALIEGGYLEIYIYLSYEGNLEITYDVY
ncbi:MAG: hypothetical protein ACI39Q_00215 [Wujia sp.]